MSPASYRTAPPRVVWQAYVTSTSHANPGPCPTRADWTRLIVTRRRAARSATSLGARPVSRRRVARSVTSLRSARPSTAIRRRRLAARSRLRPGQGLLQAIECLAVVGPPALALRQLRVLERLLRIGERSRQVTL